MREEKLTADECASSDAAGALQCFKKLYGIEDDEGDFGTIRASAANNIGHTLHKQAGKDLLKMDEVLDWYGRGEKRRSDIAI